jgi:hypothetical protein
VLWVEVKFKICNFRGSGSHVVAGYLGYKENEYVVNVLTRQPKLWLEGVENNGGMIVHCRKFFFSLI